LVRRNGKGLNWKTVIEFERRKGLNLKEGREKELDCKEGRGGGGMRRGGGGVRASCASPLGTPLE
jgi:hypothetical protein